GATWLAGGGPNGTQVTIPAGASSILTRIATIDDTVPEPTESFNLGGVAVSGTILGVSPGLGTIIDNDIYPDVTIGNATAVEGTPLVFDITLSMSTNEQIDIDLTASGGTATAGVDYQNIKFEFSTDRGATWAFGGGINGRVVSIPKGSTEILVRIT